MGKYVYRINTHCTKCTAYIRENSLPKLYTLGKWFAKMHILGKYVQKCTGQTSAILKPIKEIE